MTIIYIIIAITIYFLIGYLLIKSIEPDNTEDNSYYFRSAFLVGILSCIAYYSSWLYLGLEAYKGVEGLFTPDSSTYYLDAVRIAENNFSGEILGSIITDHYHELFLAVQIYIFGEHVLIPKIYLVMLFSIAVVLWTSIARDILQEQVIVKYFFYLLLFCLPLWTYNATVLKEMPLFFATSVTIYGFSKYTYSQAVDKKNIWITLVGIVLIFIFRRQYGLVMLFSLIIASVFGAGLSLHKKIMWMSVSVLAFFMVSALPVFDWIGAANPLTEGGGIKTARSEGGGVIIERTGGGMFGGAMYLITNPTVVAPMFIYGVLMMFFHPPFLYSPVEMIERGNLGYLVMGYYNFFFALLLPALIFGFWYLFNYRRNDPVLIAMLAYFILTSIGVIFGSDSYRRFKVSYFWPIVFIYVSYGLATYHLWKKYLPLVSVGLLALLVAYFYADIIGFVSD